LQIAGGHLDPIGKRIVAVCTGHGLKDPEIITRSMRKPLVIAPKLQALEEVIIE
jgi:threonine synthase